MDIVPIGVTLKRKNTHLCSICQSPQKKNGQRNGKQRWRCTNCNASTTHNRPDLTARNQLASFITWLMGKLTQAEHAGGTGRTFRHQTQWCWNIHPYLNHTGEVFDEIQVDGIYLRRGWCLLIAIANGKVIFWQWCDNEKATAWTALLQHLPEPKVIVTDGGSGLMKALKNLWSEVKIQRCLVHIQRNVRTHLTLNPRLAAGKTLRQLSLQLTRIRTQEEAAAWMAAFVAWHAEYQDLLNERTYAGDGAGPRPKGLRKTRTWWYTHDRLRKAYESMNRALRRGHLFTYLDHDLEGLGICATTNMIEGAINSGIREMIRNHRGMPIEHRRRACEWFCWTHAGKSSRPTLPALIKANKAYEQEQAEAKQNAAEEPVGPELFGTAAVAEEGLYSRAGWAGRNR
ncbi:IS1249 family transposase [Glutamicibacter mysorens]|uniref:IS1249 family transposase n=1 Tax=Glutamicibacter mysorens TaxID=257984 RepID=UPI0020C6F62D|nr:IS1249 family transposase [Glutamicibacter mysorens]UTM48361.1 IS1249 family transposase [Glutamicibacter mysorens]